MPTNAILLVAHGSRLDSANRDLQWLSDSLSARRPDDLIETAFLEIAEPDIPTGGARCVERGADRVLLGFPSFSRPAATPRCTWPNTATARPRVSPMWSGN
ncbi:MAG: hypothetical protein Ct9H300mP1_00490 [Planctomycetaceae bacterium]|nr:MAG: hypothetical protein Ct9H300mP1_00490 [Planctomycetaceae bacterium]